MLKIALQIALRTLMFLRRIALVVTLSLGFVVAGLILTLRYAVLPDIERYHDDITHTASKAIGLAVEIGKIEADWHGIGPHLRLSDIRILDKQKRTTLALQRVDIVVSWMTLLAGELRLASLEIDQPDLMVKRDVRGVLQISGVPLGGKSSDNNIADMLLNQSRIVVRGAHISWLDEQQAAPLLVFDQVSLVIENFWNYHRFAMRATPPKELSTQLDVRGDFYGKSFDDIPGWSGEIFTQLDYANLPAWKVWLPLPDALKQGRGGLRAWLGVEEGKISQLTADLALVNVQTRLAVDLPPLDIRVLSGRFAWRDVAHGFEIYTRNFSLKLFNNFVLKPTDVFLNLKKSYESHPFSGEIRANFLELEGLGKLMEYLPLEQKLKNQLAEFSPQGNVSNLQAKWQIGTDNKVQYKVKGLFGDLSLSRVGNLPGFSGLSGEVDGTESSGTLSVNSRNLKLDAPQFMPAPVTFDTIAAQSNWAVNAGGLEVNLRNVAVDNADIAGTAYGNYQTSANSPGKVDLTVHLSRVSVPHAGRYIPLIALGKDAQTWISKSLLDGQSYDFNLRLKGDMNDFPFVDNRKGIFKINARAKNVALGFAPGWPNIENANAELLIQGKTLAVTAASAMTGGVLLKNIRVSIPDVLSKDLLLNIHGDAEGEHARALEFVHISPVRGYLGGFTDDIVARGTGKLKLSLDIPLSGSQPVKVAGSYHFTDSEIEFDKNLPTLRKVNGDLLFTESSISTQNVVMQILGGPAKLEVENGVAGAINVKLGGRANFGVLHEINPNPLLRKLSGETDWNVEIGVKDKQSKVLLTSSLSGLQSELPAPFSKRADTVIPVRFEMKDLSAKHASLMLQYGSLLNANLLRVKNEEGIWNIKRGIVNFANVAKRPDREGIWVTGTLPQLSLDGWGGLAGVTKGNASEPVVVGGDLLIKKLTGFGNVVNDLRINANTRNGLILAQLTAREVNGELNWRAGDVQSGGSGRLVARLKNLDLVQVDSDKKSQTGKNPQEKAADPVSLPVIDLAIDKLSVKGRQLGKLEILAQQQGQDYKLDYLRLINPDGVLSVDGKWKMAEGSSQTQVNLKLEISNAGNILARAGYPDSLKNGSGKLEGSFAWPGSPGMYSVVKLNGKLSLDTGKGQFMQIDPGIGKLLSILSLQALPKHITLDFEDVFSKGFEFDNITGSADIRQGVIFTDDLKIEGSSAKVTMSGQMDLTNETQNLHVLIVPAVGNSVALITALVAADPFIMGPVVFLTNKILNDPLGQLVSFEYNVSGSWVNPKVEKVGESKPAQ